VVQCLHTMGGQISEKQISDFLSLFDYDHDDAIQAIKNHQEQRTLAAANAQVVPERPMGRTIIEVKDLTKEYKVGHQKVAVLNGVTFDVHEGEFLAITAPSGSGKSTLLQLMGGLEKPSSGSITINGIAINELSDRKLSEFRGQTIGFVFQFFYLQPFLSLERNLEVPGMFAHMKRHERQTRARELAETVGIADRLNHLPKELSGGQIQRAAIVRALLNNPKIIIADEPTGNLDSKNSASIVDLFERIRSEFHTTIVVATHNQEIADKADRVLRLKDGVLA
jgi:ABC-type lipoprotein export system ATPase subunit